MRLSILESLGATEGAAEEAAEEATKGGGDVARPLAPPPMCGSKRARAAAAGRAMGASMQSKKYCQSALNSSHPRLASVGAPGAVATCALKSLDVNSRPLDRSCVTTVSGHRGVGAVVNASIRPPPKSSSSPLRSVRSRARGSPSGVCHAAASTSELAGVPGSSAAYTSCTAGLEQQTSTGGLPAGRAMSTAARVSRRLGERWPRTMKSTAPQSMAWANVCAKERSGRSRSALVSAPVRR
mmetsp:Transcript_25580/g.64018  ORF Transcript_25580/g.64018 Transcript_25580/m.64018 type:complete len:240 (+) Transcript_25580:1181-1900(+)